jgi:hypothetical protein
VKHSIEQTAANTDPETHYVGWVTVFEKAVEFSESAVKLLCKFFVTNKNLKKVLVCIVT